MHEIDDAVIHDGKPVLSGLPFAEGQHVRVVVAEKGEMIPKRLSIQEVRKLLGGAVERFDDPFEPMIPPDHWEMLK
ncbi:MAG TPA: hypothetical protein VHY37_09275 [Tepidisphaeraceae bacterium]|jgi:hypothetical protein|nr:hypothetical protein [Tepidisphaeraceae bacterium]